MYIARQQTNTATRTHVETTVNEAMTEVGPGDDLEESLIAVKKQVKTESCAAVKYVEEIRVLVTELKVGDAIDEQGSGDTEFKAALGALLADVPKIASAVNQAVSKLKSAVKKSKNKKSKGKKGETELQINHPLAKMLLDYAKTLDADASVGLKMSRREAQNGDGPHQFVLGVPQVRAVMKISGLSGHQKWVAKQLTKEGDRSSAMSHFRTKGRELVQTELIKHLPDFFCDIHAPQDKKELVKEIFDAQAYAQTFNHVYTGLLPHGIAECRLLTEGTSLIFGMPVENMRGDTLQKKDDWAWTPSGIQHIKARPNKNKT